MTLPISKQHKVFGVANSDLTGAPYFIGDLRQLTLSIESQTNSASIYTLVGTNADGLQSALPTPSQTLNGPWSIITALTAQGMYAFDPGALGYRWLNAFRPSASSITMILAGRT